MTPQATLDRIEAFLSAISRRLDSTQTAEGPESERFNAEKMAEVSGAEGVRAEIRDLLEGARVDPAWCPAPPDAPPLPFTWDDKILGLSAVLPGYGFTVLYEQAPGAWVMRTGSESLADSRGPREVIFDFAAWIAREASR